MFAEYLLPLLELSNIMILHVRPMKIPAACVASSVSALDILCATYHHSTCENVRISALCYASCLGRAHSGSVGVQKSDSVTCIWLLLQYTADGLLSPDSNAS